MMIQAKTKGEWFEIQVPSQWNGHTIVGILKEKWHAPKGLLHQYRMEKSIKLNNEATAWNQKLTLGDRLQIRLFVEEDFGVVPEYLPVEPIFVDEHLLIVNKPAGMDTHPTEKGQTGTLANAIASYWQMNGLFTKVRHIHRLDRETSGGLIFAKHALAGAVLDRMLSEREIRRSYVGFVEGVVHSKKGTIDHPIGRDRHHPTRRRVSPSGDTAITEYKVLEVFPRNRVSLVQLTLKTGRTHQIRVHMSYLGHPLLGDDLYGGPLDSINRQALHAYRIQLPHPFLDASLDVEIPWPDDLLELKEKLK
jgi:23S rRNA pseudouridine1911/1915/1917 synthase